jgi:hypothetical protein
MRLKLTLLICSFALLGVVAWRTSRPRVQASRAALGSTAVLRSEIPSQSVLAAAPQATGPNVPKTVAENLPPDPTAGKSTGDETVAEPFWIAGRYDGDKVIVYFDAVKFGNTFPENAPSITPPVAGGFLEPVELPDEYVASFQKGPTAEHFAVGDKYDVLSGCRPKTVTLTKVVGAQSDEAVGNDSYIGALATFRRQLDADAAFYLAMRRHHETQDAGPRAHPGRACAGLGREPVPFETQTQIVALLTQRMKEAATESEKAGTEGVSPIFDVHSFYTADGSERYYARIEWASGNDEKFKVVYALGAWLAPDPSLRILVAEPEDSRYSSLDSAVPELLTVANLGDGRTGMIMGVIGLDSTYINLYEYSDGSGLKGARLIQSIGVGE